MKWLNTLGEEREIDPRKVAVYVSYNVKIATEGILTKWILFGHLSAVRAQT